MKQSNAAKEINIKELLDIIKRRIWIVITIILLFIGIGYYSSTKYTPMYSSSTRIIIEANSGNMNTLQVILKDRTVLDKVVAKMNLPLSGEQLANYITVENINSSEVVSISVTYFDPENAANIANNTAKVFKEQLPTITGFEGITVLSDAKVNPNPVNDDTDSTILKYSIIGIALAIGAAFLLHAFDNRVHNEHEIEEITGLPVIGQVSKIKKKIMSNKVSETAPIKRKKEIEIKT